MPITLVTCRSSTTVTANVPKSFAFLLHWVDLLGSSSDLVYSAASVLLMAIKLIYYALGLGHILQCSVQVHVPYSCRDVLVGH